MKEIPEVWEMENWQNMKNQCVTTQWLKQG